jgi:transcription factor S
MVFCPKCGGLLLPRKGKKGFKCACGHTQKEPDQPTIKEAIKQEKDLSVIDKEIDPSPEIDATCFKCGHKKARFWTVQTRASDEPETKFIKCEKCGHTWRDYN